MANIIFIPEVHTDFISRRSVLKLFEANIVKKPVFLFESPKLESLDEMISKVTGYIEIIQKGRADVLANPAREFPLVKRLAKINECSFKAYSILAKLLNFVRTNGLHYSGIDSKLEDMRDASQALERVAKRTLHDQALSANIIETYHRFPSQPIVVLLGLSHVDGVLRNLEQSVPANNIKIVQFYNDSVCEYVDQYGRFYPGETNKNHFERMLAERAQDHLPMLDALIKRSLLQVDVRNPIDYQVLFETLCRNVEPDPAALLPNFLPTLLDIPQEAVCSISGYSALLPNQFTGDEVFQICLGCGKYGEFLRCQRCHKAFYCNATCQRNHWPLHKHFTCV